MIKTFGIAGVAVAVAVVVVLVWVWNTAEAPGGETEDGVMTDVPAEFESVLFRSVMNVQGRQQVRTLYRDGTLVQSCEFPICSEDQLGTTTVAVPPAVFGEIETVLATVETAAAFEPEPGVLYESTVSYEHVVDGVYVRHTTVTEPISTVVGLLDQSLVGAGAE